MADKLSIQQIAEMAGVSTATVSRILNKNGYVSNATREKVTAIIEKTGYQPSIAARELRTGSVPMAGILLPRNAGEYMLQIVSGLQSRLQRQGYNSVLLSADGLEDVTGSYLYMQNRLNLAGWFHIFCEAFIPEPSVPTIPIAWYDETISGNVTYVNTDYYGSAVMAIDELVRSGCRHILCITHNRQPLVLQRHHINKPMEDGLANAFTKHGLPFGPATVIRPAEISYEAGYRAIRRVLDAHIPLDGIYCTGNRYMPGILQAITDAGYKVPEDIRLVGNDDNPISAMLLGGLTTIRTDVGMLTEKAVASLESYRNGVKPDDVYVPVTLIRRNST